jgi:release factor glutamine methyltransferase
VANEVNSDLLSSPRRWEHFVGGQVLWEWRQAARQAAIAADISPFEVDWLLQELAGLDRLALRLETFKTQAQIPLRCAFTELNHLWQQRLQDRVPVQYLVGVAPWREFLLQVSPAVLIPRPETECLIDLAQQAIATADPTLAIGQWADLGTGSGAIAIGLATALPQATIHAVDRSAAALEIARTNAATYGLGDRIHFYQGDWFAPIEHLRGNLSGMVANPPYIPSQMVLALQPEVTQHEPHLALDGGADGLDCVRQLIALAPDYLRSGGIWLVELMAGQAAIVAQLLDQQSNYTNIQIHPDLAGIDRFVLAHRS